MSDRECHACGSAVSEDAVRCENCGAQLGSHSDPGFDPGPLDRHVPRSPSMVTRPPSGSGPGYCTKCGTALLEDASECPSCGTPVPQ
jgi:RNA polymerase subunit RPABC4/transcription elongation factor Spt4